MDELQARSAGGVAVITTRYVGKHVVKRCTICGEVDTAAFKVMRVFGNVSAEFYPMRWAQAFKEDHKHDGRRERRRKGQLI